MGKLVERVRGELAESQHAGATAASTPEPESRDFEIGCEEAMRAAGYREEGVVQGGKRLLKMDEADAECTRKVKCVLAGRP